MKKQIDKWSKYEIIPNTQLTQTPQSFVEDRWSKYEVTPEEVGLQTNQPTAEYYKDKEFEDYTSKAHYQEAVIILLFSIIQMIVTYKMLKSSIKEVSLKTLINISLRVTACATLWYMVFFRIDKTIRLIDVLEKLSIFTPISYIVIYILLRFYNIEKPFKHTCGYIFNTLIVLAIVWAILRVANRY